MADENAQPAATSTPAPSASPATSPSPSAQPSAAPAAAASAPAPQTQPAATPAAATPAAAAKPERPAYIPARGWDDTTGTPKNEWIAEQAALESRRLVVPGAPEKYEPKLPASFKAPDGFGEIKVDDQSPEFQQFRQFAHSRGMTQDDFSDALAIHMAMELRQQQQIKAARETQIAKLGAGASSRMDAVTTFIDATAPPDVAAEVKNMLVTEKIVRYFESQIQKSQTQGAGNFSQAHRASPEANGKIPGYDKMTFEQRRAAQDAMRPSRT